MNKSWSNWKRFPDANNGGVVEAPIGPGVYEVRRADNGELVAFGHSGNVANSISELKVENRRSGWISMFRRQPVVPASNNLEYRTFAAASRSEAKTVAQRFMGLRQTYWRHRASADWASGGRV
jgi:hypothetical protein